MNEDHYNFTYELAGDFTSFPTNAVTVAHGSGLLENITEVPGLPEFNPMSLLHGTEDVFIEKPLVPGTKYIVTDKFKDF